MPTGEQRLRASGLRVTRPRVVVLDVLSGGGRLEVEGLGHGFDFDEAEITFRGRCPSYQREREADRAA
jgi:Fe2+ or Zn2+ uptake regulation protein